MNRRELITLLGGVAAMWSFAARAQQPRIPVVGFLNTASPDGHAAIVSAFRQGLNQIGYVDGQNVTIEYRWAEGHNERLPAMAADLVRRQVAVIVATSAPAALAAKAATATIPIVFETGADPVTLGLVASLSRPGGNITGVTQANVELAPKRLQLLHEVIPTTKVMGLLVNPADGVLAENYTKEVQAAARSLGLQLHVLIGSAERDFDSVFAKLIEVRAGGLVISGGAFLTNHSGELALLAVRHAVPTIFQSREFALAGGLLSYGAAITEAYRIAGTYAGRILKGERPADLPVQQATKVAMYINLKTAKALGLTVPDSLLARADEAIE
ncbi:MAG TPA: ABC transporter substrate-binding protein [Propionibacteriaceae bacterium]|nr:ABC transporter substrate-binding protein [Propionibacteriaceae bacterium]